MPLGVEPSGPAAAITSSGCASESRDCAPESPELTCRSVSTDGLFGTSGREVGLPSSAHKGAEAPRGGQCGGRAGTSLARPDEKPLPGLPRPNVLIPPVYPPQHHREAVGSPRNTLYFLVAADRHCDNEQREHARLFVAGKLNVYIAAAASIYGT